MGFYYFFTYVLAGGDPHFMIRIHGMEYPLCFDLHANPGEVLRILADQESGLHTNLKHYIFNYHSIYLIMYYIYLHAFTCHPRPVLITSTDCVYSSVNAIFLIKY